MAVQEQCRDSVVSHLQLDRCRPCIPYRDERKESMSIIAWRAASGTSQRSLESIQALVYPPHVVLLPQIKSIFHPVKEIFHWLGCRTCRYLTNVVGNDDLLCKAHKYTKIDTQIRLIHSSANQANLHVEAVGKWFPIHLYCHGKI